MAIPQLRSEGVDAGGTASTTTPAFSSFTWQANDIIEIVVATDGPIPTLSTANGFAVAQDPAGNSASVSTSGGTAGAANAAVVIFWKRATGSTTASDPAPTIAMNGATSWCLEPNSYSGCRTSGTPYHQIATATLTSASTSVTTPALTSSLANCLFLGLVATAEDDSAFNNFTMSGSSGPAAGAPSYGWHNGSGNHSSFTGADGGYATAGGPHSATVTLSISSNQAKIGRILASLAEPAGITGNEAATLGPSTPASSGGVSLTGNAIAVDSVSTPTTSGGVTVTGTVNATLDASSGAASGSTITRTGTTAATLGASTAASSGSVTGGPTGTESATLAGSTGAAAGTVSVGGNEARALDASTPASAGAVSVTGNAAASDSPSSAAASGTVFTAATLALGALAFHERANTLAPNIGTLTTRAVYPAWTPSTTYHCNTNDRVTNGGNTYEIAVTSGTSASSIGPTTTPAPIDHGAITDGSAKWNFLAAGTGAVNTQTGSVILVSVGQGNDSGSGGTAPTDNKGNTYTQQIRSTFAGFPQSSAVTWAKIGAIGGSGHTFSVPWSAGLDGGGDEKTIAVVEVVGGTRIQDHSSIEATPNGSNVCTSASVTTTGPAVLVCFCWPNGGTSSDGTLHVAVPGSGFSILPLASGLMEIGNTAGEVDMLTIARTVSGPGTFTASITTGVVNGTPEGAVMHLFAIQGPQGVTGNESAQLSGSVSASSGTVTTPRIGTGAGALDASVGASAGAVTLTGNAAATDGDSSAATAGAVAVTGNAAASGGGSTAQSSGTLIPVITGNEASVLGASVAASFGQVFSGHAGLVAAALDSSLGTAAGGVLVTGSGATLVHASVPASGGVVQVTGNAAPSSGDSQVFARGTVGLPGGVLPRLVGILSTQGQLTGTLQLQGVTVAVIEGPITVFQGDTAQYLLIVTDDDGQPFPLSTATAIDVRVAPVEGASVSIALALGAGVQLLDESTSKGRAVIAFGSTDTAIAPNRYRMNVKVTAPGLAQHVIAPRDFIIAAVV